MLKISLDVKNAPPFADEENVISASGGLADIAAEMLYAIGNVYNTLKTGTLLLRTYFAPCWSEA